MLDMSKQEEIYELRARGSTISEIARKLSIDRKTVRNYLARDDFSPQAPNRKKRPSKLDPYKPIIDSWLEADKHVFRKQRHSAARVHERLREEHGFVCGITIVQEYVRLKRDKQQKESSLDLDWDPGFAQVDFGDVDIELLGQKVRGHLLAVSFPHSNMGYGQFFLGESAECVCQGLADVFTHIGGVPHTIIFDNATGVGRRICDRVRETELFSRFRMHHSFSVRFCNPGAGHEKGNVERKVPYLRQKLFVPVPTITSIDTFNEGLLKSCAFQEEKMHHRKDKKQGVLFEKDSAALMSLPRKPFDVCRYVEVTSNGYGHVTLDARHTYSTHPSNVRAKTICAVRATKVEFISEQGELLASHLRSFGKKKTETIDPTSQLQILAKRPGGWSNSRIRSDFPPSVVSYLDKLERPKLKESLDLLNQASARNGLAPTLEALEKLACKPNNSIDFFSVGVLAARIANFGLDTEPDSGADLSCYDRIFLNGDANAFN